MSYYTRVKYSMDILYFFLEDQKLSILRDVRELKSKNMHLYDTLVKVLKKPKMKPRETTPWLSK